MTDPEVNARAMRRVVRGRETSDGAGVRLLRSLGNTELAMHDPFLLLDEFRSDRADDYIAGFPDHPHRGFETVTYMLAGSMEHRDSVGNRGLLEPGSVQWMTAGRGIIHSEMPRQEEGLMWGFQLWVNLPARLKKQEPRYQDIPASDVPVVELPGARVKIIAGELEGHEGPVRGVVTDPQYLDVELEAGGRVSLPVAASKNAFVYAFEGSVVVPGADADESNSLARGELGVLGTGDGVVLEAGTGGGRCLVVAGNPIGEEVARHGPFVMNTWEEIREALDDFRSGRLVG